MNLPYSIHMVAHIFTLLLAPFAFKLVNYSRHSDILKFLKNSKSTSFSFENSSRTKFVTNRTKNVTKGTKNGRVQSDDIIALCFFFVAFHGLSMVLYGLLWPLVVLYSNIWV